ncbi:MAG: 50S ribosomal protein L1 [Actinomycetota bacterium]
MKRGKTYNAAAAKVEADKIYTPLDAIKIIKENATAKFDETVDIAIRLGLDTRKADQQVRGTVILPNGTGRSVRVAVFAQGEKAREAMDAGADVVGAEDLAEEVTKGRADFDVAIATPDMMGTVGKLGKVLGPRGLMPNPKTGTVTFDIGKAVKDSKMGKVEYRADKFGIVHLVIGKRSFEETALADNYKTLMDEIIRAKPAGAKGRYIKGITLSSTMGPGLKVDPSKIRDLAAEAS